MNERLLNALANESEETWNQLTKRLLAYACVLLRGRRWRCANDGVPPDGHDAESIVQDAFAQLFSGSGWNPTGDPYSQDELRFELRRLVHNRVRNLERRKENELFFNEPDLAPTGDGPTGGFFDNLPGEESPEETKVQKEQGLALLQKFQSQFRAFLDRDDLLIRLFNCVCDGNEKRSDQAEFLGITPKQVTNARKRLDRKLEEFAEQYPDYPTAFIAEVKNA